MGAHGVVVAPPCSDLFARVTERPEPVKVQAFISQLPVQALDEGALHGFLGLDEPEANAGALQLFEHGSARSFGSVVEDDLLRQAEFFAEFVEIAGDACA